MDKLFKILGGRSPLNRKTRLVLLFLLYLSQGLPFGFQVKALPLYLREYGVSLTAIGMVGALALPWILKPLWSPLVDRFGSRKIGRRKSWIIPLQISLCLTILSASLLSVKEDLFLLLATVFLMNLFAATQDIAVDGLAVDMLGEEDLGHGNASQVVGYKTGMLLSGGLLVWLSGTMGWNVLFIFMALASLLPMPLLLLYREAGAVPDAVADSVEEIEESLKEIFLHIIKVLRLPGSLWLILLVGTYKTGESMIDAMFKLFLIDSGFTAQTIGLWIGTYGMAASLGGSIAGGFFSSRLGLFRALVIASALRVLPLAGEWLLTFTIPGDLSVISITLGEHFFGGMLTTSMFAYMMHRVDRSIGATHFTVLAGIEVLGKSPGSWLSGLIAENFGYSVLFSIGVIISILVLPIYIKLKPEKKHA